MHSALLVAHADILKMAKTREKRERIKWFHARQLFFARRTIALGLELARDCDHEDARFLVSLFPNGAPKTREKAMAVFLSLPDDARCVCWSVQCDMEPKMEEMMASVEKGHAWAQALVGGVLSGRQESDSEAKVAVTWLEKAVAQGERDGMTDLSFVLARGTGCEKDEVRARQMMLEGASLGCAEAQKLWSQLYCEKGSLESFAWNRRCIAQRPQDPYPVYRLSVEVPAQLQLYDAGGSGRKLYEIGWAFSRKRISGKYWTCFRFSERSHCISNGAKW